MPELLAQRLGGHFPDLPGELDAGRPRSHQGEGEPASAFGRVVGRLGHLERAEYPPPDLPGVLDGFHPGREGSVLVMPEIGLPDPGRQDEVVIAELHLLTQRAPGQHPPLLRVEAGHLGQDELDVAELVEQLAQREGDLALGQDAGGALVQQWREQVMLSPVEQGHLDRCPPQRPGGEQAGQPAADDHYPTGAGCLGHGSPRPSVASHSLRALIAMVIAREPLGIALI